MVAPKDVWKLVRPIAFGLVKSSFQSTQDHLICSLSLPIGLGMFDRRKRMFDPKVGHQFMETFVSKLGSIVGDGDYQYPEPHNDVLFEERNAILSSDGCQGFRFDPFSEIIHDRN